MPSRKTRIRLASITFCVASSLTISSSSTPAKSGHLIMPLDEFKVLCEVHLAGISKNRFIVKRFLECCAFSTSINKVPFFSLLTKLILFSITKDDSFVSGFSGFNDSMIRKRANGPVVSVSACLFSSSFRVRFLSLGIHDLRVQIHHSRPPPTSESNKGDMASRAEYPALHVRATQMIYSGHAN